MCSITDLSIDSEDQQKPTIAADIFWSMSGVLEERIDDDHSSREKWSEGQCKNHWAELGVKREIDLRFSWISFRKENRCVNV